jgi:hypothetical protein
VRGPPRALGRPCDHRQKMWLVGRAYAAQVERRRTNDRLSSDDFYIERLAPTVRTTEIDTWFQNLREDRSRNKWLTLDVHRSLSIFSNRLPNSKSGRLPRNICISTSQTVFSFTMREPWRAFGRISASHARTSGPMPTLTASTLISSTAAERRDIGWPIGSDAKILRQDK